MNPHVVGGIRICEATRHTHDTGNVRGTQTVDTSLKVAELTQRFVWRDRQKVRPTQNVDTSNDRIERCRRLPTILPHGEVVAALVIAVTNVYFFNAIGRVRTTTRRSRQETGTIVIKRKVTCDEGNGGTRPNTCVWRQGNARIPLPRRYLRLAIFADARAGKQTKSSPVIACILLGQEGLQGRDRVALGGQIILERNKHRHSKGLLLGFWRSPCNPLTQLLRQVGVQRRILMM